MDVDTPIRAMVRQALGRCDQDNLDALMFELTLSGKITADRLEAIMGEELANAHGLIQEFWGRPVEGHVDPIALLRFSLPDGREESYGWTGPWPPPEKMVRVTGPTVPDERLVAIAALEDIDLAEMERDQMVVSIYKREVVATFEDNPAFYAAAVFVLDGHQS